VAIFKLTLTMLYVAHEILLPIVQWQANLSVPEVAFTNLQISGVT